MTGKMHCVLLLLVALFVRSLRAEREPYALPDGVHCFPCPPGTRVDAHCTEDLTHSSCLPCRKHHFSDQPNNEKFCSHCRGECPKNSFEFQSCTNSTNKECRCEEGHHEFPLDRHDHEWTECRKHTKCERGQGEVSSGNHSHDTQCRPCTKGEEFVNTTDPDHPKCQTCTDCPPGAVVSPCFFSNDAVCNDNATFESSTEASVTNAPEKPSGSLSGGAIAAIVYVCLWMFGIVAAVIFWLIAKKKDLELNWDKRLLISLAIWTVLGFGLFVVAGLCIYLHRRGLLLQCCRDPENPDGTGEVRFENDTDDHPSNGTGNTANGGPSVPGSGSDAADPMLEQNPSDNVTADQNWSLDFITGKIFIELSNRLTFEWKLFIVQLPGWSNSSRANAVIAHRQIDEKNVKDMIYGCLMDWKNECREHVTKVNILKTLEQPAVNRSDTKAELEKMAVNESPP